MDRFEASERRRKLRERAIDFLGGSCHICGYDGPAIEAFDFHHTDPMAKDFVISSKMTSWKAIADELLKCILLCSRCHREVHAGHHPSYLVHADDDRSGY